MGLGQMHGLFVVVNRFSSLFAPGLFAPTLSSLSLCLAVAGTAHAQPTLPNLPPPPQTTTTVALDRTAPNSLDPNAIGINIDGRNVISDPPPLLQNGRTFVPLRGVLENLGARVNYIAAERRVDIARDGQNVALFLGTTRATVDGRAVEVEKPLLVNGRTFVPLRAVAELFGLRVAWLAPTRTVAIYTGAPIARAADHRAELREAGPLGVTIDFAAHPPSEVPVLLDAAKNAGASLVKFRFDWGTLEPTKDAAYQWPIYDTIVREARARDLKIVGILGDTAPWASVSSSNFGADKRQSPPREAELPSWSNYVRRVVGRYGRDVSAWQVWENPNSVNFRSVSRNYRKLANLALSAARGADARAIVFLADPGGVDLDALRGYGENGLNPDGLAIYPVAQFQPNALAAPEAFLRPYAQLRQSPGQTRARDYWVGGLSYPVALPFPGATVSAEGQASLRLFTPLAQADYLVKSMTLALATGSDKVFWNQLRDIGDARMAASLGETNPTQPAPPAAIVVTPATSVEAAPNVEPVNDQTPVTDPATPAPGADPMTNPVGTAPFSPVAAAPDSAGLVTGSASLAAPGVSAPREGVVLDDGLQRADGTPRPAYAAFRNLAQTVGRKPYRGHLSFNSNLVALLFDDGQNGFWWRGLRWARRRWRSTVRARRSSCRAPSSSRRGPTRACWTPPAPLSRRPTAC